jgi:hypothetical protein
MIKDREICVKSSFGHTIRNRFFYHEPGTGFLAVLFPGAGNSCDFPPLDYARKAALNLGFDVLSLEYGYYRTGNLYRPEFMNDILIECNAAVDECRSNTEYQKIVFISKSMGTVAAGEIGGLPVYKDVFHVFLTPVKKTIPYIRRAPCAVIYGTADPLLAEEDAELIKGILHADVLEIGGASHSLEDMSDYKKSLEMLKIATEHVEKTLRSVISG